MAEGEDVPKDFIKSDDAENEADVSDDEEALLAKLSPGQGEAGAIGGGGDGPAQVRGRSGSLGAKKPFGGAGIGGKKRHAKRSNIFLHKQGLTHDHPALNVPRKELRFAKNSRKSRNTFGRGLPKKGGAGGKGVWGRPGRAELQAPPEVDEHDPNYDSDSLDNGNVKLEEVRIQPTDEEVAKMVTSTILEYFEHGETEEAFESLQEQLWDCQSRAFMIPKIALEIAMEHKPSHRELISRLLGDLYGRAFGADDIAKAFDLLLSDLPDLTLDTPDAAHVLGNFIARAIADDCLAPKYIEKERAKQGTEDLAIKALSRAESLLSMKHGLVRLDNVWGAGGGLRPVKSLVRKMTLLLEEYLSARDITEATRCLVELEVPHFHHELVYEAVVIVLERMNPDIQEAMCRLLHSLSDSVIITVDQMTNGFLRIFDAMPDISLDVPAAYVVLEQFVNRCRQAGFLPEEVARKMPSRGRKRFVSEGDGGRVKESFYVGPYV